MKKNWRWFVVALLLAALAVPAHAETNSDEQTVLAELFTLNRQLDQTRTGISQLDGQLQALDSQQAAARAEADRLEQRRRDRQALLALRLRYYSEHGSFAPIEILLEANSLTNFLDRLNALSLVMHQDAAVLSDLHSLEQAKAEQERQIAQTLADTARVRSELAAEEDQLQGTIAQKEAILQGLRENRAAVEQKLASLDQYWNETARPLLESLGASLQAVDLKGLQPDSIRLGLFPPGITATITADTLNQAFLQHDDRLKGLTFQFRQGAASLQGSFGGSQLVITGSFSVQGRTVLRFTPQSITIGDFKVPQSATDQLLAEGRLDIDLGSLIKPWALQDVHLTDGSLAIQAGV